MNAIIFFIIIVFFCFGTDLIALHEINKQRIFRHLLLSLANSVLNDFSMLSFFVLK